MKVLLINGSPKEKGSTYTALNVIADELKKQSIESEIFHIGNEAISGCLGCKYCKTHPGECVKNDIVNIAKKKVEEADGIIVGSPVHYAAISGGLTCFLDRLFYSSAKLMENKPASSIVVLRRGGATAALEQLNKYFTIANMPIVSSQYWNMVHGNNGEEILKDEEGLQTMRVLAKNMAWLLNCIKAGDEKGIKRPQRDAKINTNFIR